jgi:diacylglycerol O-acyltransferase
MSAVDAAWYRMDGPANTAVVTCLVLMPHPPDIMRIRRLMKQRLLRFERFRQRVVERGSLYATPAWEDTEVDIEDHVRQASLAAPADEVALRGFVEKLAGTPLDREKPLWQAHVVDNVGTGGALVMRYHHCIGDGTAMMAVAGHLFDTSSRAMTRKTAHPTPTPAGATLVDDVLMLAGEAAAVVADVLKWPDPGSPIKGRYGIPKRVAWSAPVSLDDVKTIGAPTGAKVNDVLVAAITGALRCYLVRRGVDVGRATLRAMVPVDLRTPERLGELGNEFGLVLLELPVSERTASMRLASTQERMNALKRSPEGPAMRHLLDLFGRGPKILEDVACGILGDKASVVLTNVAGPRETIRLAGEPVDRLMFCVPHPGDRIGMGISIFSYRGFVTVTVIADAGLVPHPESITKAFGREIDLMKRYARRRRQNRGVGPTSATRLTA